MRPPSASELLAVWEQGLAQPPAQRALALLAAACPDATPGALAELSIGQRDARLLALREWLFGPHVASLASCPGCGERLELGFDVADIRTPSPAQGEGGEGVTPLSLTVDGYEVRFRLPNSLDLLALAGQEEGAAARRLLLDRCVLTARRDGEEMPPDQLPDDVIRAVAERMDRADPVAEVRLDLSCPACGHRWLATFDIVSFIWSEIDAWACRTMNEVHVLASAYGWREADVLATSPWRRRLYLQMVGA